jgi:ferritin-like metal-binding protein YciE
MQWKEMGMPEVQEGQEVQEQLVKYIDEAYAMEQNVLRMLDGMIETSEDPEMRSALEEHKRETEDQAERLKQRLAAHDASPSMVKEAGGILGAMMKGIVDMARADKAGRNARDGYATEHMEIASYQLLERVATLAGDPETAAVARQNRAEEEAMARRIDQSWDKAAALSLEQEGVPSNATFSGSTTG